MKYYSEILRNYHDIMPIDTELESAKRLISAQGVTVTAWAMANGFRPSTVHSVLSGRSKGSWGEAYEVCVALKLKREIQAL